MRHFWAILVALFLLASTANAQWTTQSPSPTDLDIRGVAVSTSQRVFVASDDDSLDEGGALFESTDGGATWVQRNVPSSLGSGFFGAFFLDDQFGWAFGNENVRTTDGGTTWDAMPFIGSTYLMEFATPAFGYASTGQENWVSRDSGVSWVESPNRLFDFDFVDTQVGLGVSPGGIYKTTDGGTNFVQVHSDSAYAVAFVSSSVAVAIADDTFLRSDDGGQTWNAGASAGGLNQLHLVPGGVPRVYSFDGVYPNPFNASTTLRFGLPEVAEVEIGVYDILGRLVTRIAKGELQPGFHTIQWDATSMASGTYLVRLSTEAFSTTRRVSLVR